VQIVASLMEGYNIYAVHATMYCSTAMTLILSFSLNDIPTNNMFEFIDNLPVLNVEVNKAATLGKKWKASCQIYMKDLE